MPNEFVQIDIESLDLNAPSTLPNITNSFLDAGDLGLTPDEAKELEAYQTSNIILGPAAGSVLLCPGNQVGTPLEQRCAYYFKCPLRRMNKAPEDRLCPVERNIVEERFSAWCKELGEDPLNLSESDRSVVADLVWIDLQIQRCVNILAVGQDARLTHKNVTEAMLLDPNDEPIPITYEIVLHTATQRLDQLTIQRRMLLKEWMLTPEQRFKIAKESGALANKGMDISSEQSTRADELRKLIKPLSR